MAAGMLIIHLSDIHFVKGRSGMALDLDADVRNELELDVTALAGNVGSAQALIVTGDIAFQARDEEYGIAEKWLRELAKKVSCPEGRIWTIPGNHDFDRSTLGDLQLRAAHALLRSVDLSKLEPTLTELLQDPKMGALLLRPLQPYLRFAERFDCGFTAERPFWEHTVPLDEGFLLKVRGSTSTLVSNSDDAPRQMVLSLGAATLPRAAGTEYMALAHHPPDWLREGDEVMEQLTSRARIALFGHKHQQKLRREEDTVMLTAGAVHPYRGEKPWQPRYNMLDIAVRPPSGGLEWQLEVRVHQRVWSETTKRFEPEIHHGQSHRPYRFEIEAVPRPSAPISSGTDEALRSDARAIMTLAAAAVAEPVPEARMDTIVELAGRFWRLPYHVRVRLLRQLGLVSDEDQELPQEQRVVVAFRRARERDLLAALDAAVSDYTGQPPVGVQRRGAA